MGIIRLEVEVAFREPGFTDFNSFTPGVLGRNFYFSAFFTIFE